MTNRSSSFKNRAFVLTGLGIALLVAIFLSPFASSDPDGLDRVSEDLGFADQARAETPAHKLPFAGIFDEYALRGVPDGIATPLAGLVGTLVTFGVSWGVGKLVLKRSRVHPPNPDAESPNH
jgi:cobalt/nickel transport protein